MKLSIFPTLLASSLLCSVTFAGEHDSVAYYKDIIEKLKKSTDVLPPMPGDLAPIHTVRNREAPIPPQCYTAHHAKFNPCYVCHQEAIPGRENVMNDDDLQSAYSFSDVGMTNQWDNLFEDRSERVAAISDEEIVEYIKQDNYSDLDDRLREAGFEGWIPDLEGLEKGADAFDEYGFAKDGSHWVAFNYMPMPSTFWPTNGSTDDVMIRLDDVYRVLKDGSYSDDVYRANLAILEANFKGFDSITCAPVDEKVIGMDLNEDGKLGVVHSISKVDTYVGAAEGYFLDTFLYPEGTEFLHTVRYVDFNEDGSVTLSPRMKEVRYMKKWRAYAKGHYHRKYQLEAFEKELGNLPGYMNLGDHGLDNGNGWAIQGFIEGFDGQLRANTYEENLFCMGCHNSIGSTIDKTFSFGRKVDGVKGWSYIDLRGMPNVPNVGEKESEFLTYLKRVGGGSEFRHNDEMIDKWFNEDGSVNEAKVMAAKDMAELLAPSKERALTLNKAYRVIVEDQDFIFGRDATVVPPANVHQHIDNDSEQSLPEELTHRYDIRLDWDYFDEEIVGFSQLDD